MVSESTLFADFCFDFGFKNDFGAGMIDVTDTRFGIGPISILTSSLNDICCFDPRYFFVSGVDGALALQAIFIWFY